MTAANQDLHGVHGLRPEFPGSAPPCPLTGLASRGGRIHFDVTAWPVAPPKGAFDTGLQRRAFPPDAASLLPGALALTGTGLPPARPMRAYVQIRPPSLASPHSEQWAHELLI